VGGAVREELSQSRAVLWLPLEGREDKRRLIDLNDCVPGDTGWILECARAINGKGEIVGVGLIDGRRHAFLLHPVTAPDKKDRLQESGIR
jgi:hypothetical protein